MSQLYVIESIPIIIQSVQVADFIVEDIQNINIVQSLNGKFQKQFTSQASSYSVIFKWKFGDESNPSAYTTTKNRSIEHEYKKPGTYTVRHQACLLDAPCCYNNNIPWCVKSITIGPPVVPSGITPLLGLGLLFGLLMQREKCENKTANECKKDKNCKLIPIGNKYKCISKK